MPENFFPFKAIALNTEGIKYNINGYIKAAIKLIIESLIRWICVLTYIPQKQII